MRDATDVPGQSGERSLVLARLRAGTASPPPPLPHAPPAPTTVAPSLHDTVLDEGLALADVFTRRATSQGSTVHDLRARAPGAVAELVAELATAGAVHTVVATDESAVAPVLDALRAIGGIELLPATDREACARADLGVSGCIAAVATTGSVVLSAAVPGARWASLLPRLHLCVVGAGQVVPAPGDVLRRFDAERPPRAVWFVSGPSRTGDIEQLLTIGVHGPTALDVLLVDSVNGE